MRRGCLARSRVAPAFRRTKGSGVTAPYTNSPGYARKARMNQESRVLCRVLAIGPWGALRLESTASELRPVPRDQSDQSDPSELPGVPCETEINLAPDWTLSTGRVAYNGIPGHITDLGVLRLVKQDDGG